MIITIDGPTASGKSTVAQALAKKLGSTYINSGLLFRAVAYLLHTEHLTQESPAFKSQVPKLFSSSSSLRYSYSPTHGAQILYKNELRYLTFKCRALLSKMLGMKKIGYCPK